MFSLLYQWFVFVIITDREYREFWCPRH